MRYNFFIEMKLWKNYGKNANVFIFKKRHFAALKRKQRKFRKKNVMNSLRTGIPVSQGILLRDLSCSNDN